MKYLFILLLLPIVSKAQTSNEILAGSLTQHLFNPGGNDYNYSNRLNNNGLIDNPMIGYREVSIKGVSYTSTAYFAGDNSIGAPMAGTAWSAGYTYDGYRLGVLAGIYIQDTGVMMDRNETPPMFIPYRGIAPCPLVGVEAIKTFKLSNKTYFILNSVLTPLFINGSIGIGWNI